MTGMAAVIRSLGVVALAIAGGENSENAKSLRARMAPSSGYVQKQIHMPVQLRGDNERTAGKLMLTRKEYRKQQYEDCEMRKRRERQ